MDFESLSGPYLVIHYDIDLEEVRKVIRDYPGMMPTSKSVFALMGSINEAETFWNTIRGKTLGKWTAEDKLFIHFVGGDAAGEVWMQLITANHSSLDADPRDLYRQHLLARFTRLTLGHS